MRFLVDAQLPPALARHLASGGHEALAVREAGLREAADEVIWAYADSGKWVVVTKDEDFALRAIRKEAGPAIVWLRIGNSTNEALLGWLEPRWPAVLRELAEGSRLIEVV